MAACADRARVTQPPCLRPAARIFSPRIFGIMPATIFGSEHYGAVNGALSAPVIASKALGPLIGSVVWSSFGNDDAVLWLLTAVALLAVVSFSFAISTAKQVRHYRFIS